MTNSALSTTTMLLMIFLAFIQPFTEFSSFIEGYVLEYCPLRDPIVDRGLKIFISLNILFFGIANYIYWQIIQTKELL